MSVTFGDNFTINVLGKTLRTCRVTSAADWQEVPNAIPPSFTLGQEIFSSMAGILSRLASFSAQATLILDCRTGHIHNHVGVIILYLRIEVIHEIIDSFVLQSHRIKHP